MFRRLLLSGLVIGLGVACARPARLVQAHPRDQLYAQLIGRWQGTFDSFSLSPGDGARQAARLQVLPAPDEDGLELRYSWQDASGQPVERVDHLHLDPGMQQARWGVARDRTLQRFAIRERSGGVNGDALRLVLEQPGPAGSALRREIVEVGTGHVEFVSEELSPAGEAVVRHRYALRRAE